MAPFIAFVGVAMVVFMKNEKLHHFGNIFAGLGVLFIGMDMMGVAMKPLSNSEEFVSLLTKFENPALGILAGTVFTALLAAIGTNRNARRTTVIHISFNVIGTIVFTTLCIVTPLVSFMENLTPTNPSAQIANLHTTFNLVTSILLIPFGGLLTKFAEKVLPDRGETLEEGSVHYLLNLSHINSGYCFLSGV